MPDIFRLVLLSLLTTVTSLSLFLPLCRNGRASLAIYATRRPTVWDTTQLLPLFCLLEATTHSAFEFHPWYCPQLTPLSVLLPASFSTRCFVESTLYKNNNIHHVNTNKGYLIKRNSIFEI